VAVLTALTWFGVHKSALATRLVVAVVLAVLVAVVVAGWTGGSPRTAHLAPVTGSGFHGVLQAAGFLFFAFAGYARIATLGEEVRDPARTIPRAIPLALGTTLVVYAALPVTVLAVLGAGRAGATSAPLVAVAQATPWPWLVPVVRAGAAVAALGSLLALVLGVSRTTFAMARDRHLPGVLDAVHPRHGVPHRAQLAVGVVVAAVVLLADVRGAIGFSSVAVLAYYAIANASALTLGRDRGTRLVPALGLVGCLAVAVSLPLTTTVAGFAVLAAGALVWAGRRLARRP
jgi:APA family basic amino acid/polyamine antiporter